MTDAREAIRELVDRETRAWDAKDTHELVHWKGRACKVYTRLAGGAWKLIAHTGLLEYPGP